MKDKKKNVKSTEKSSGNAAFPNSQFSKDQRADAKKGLANSLPESDDRGTTKKT